MEVKLVPHEAFKTNFVPSVGIHVQGNYDAQFYVLPASGPVQVFVLGAAVDAAVMVLLFLL